ncbi:MAG TPA: glycosyltransferase family 2 protein [Kofleriaceae bacterium]|nr:glycosyltransferase family 2 protein [Kofleriaceae bacterium]
MEPAALAYLGVLGALAVYGAHRLYLTVCCWTARGATRAAPPPLPPELPVVTVQLPLFNELYVAERLIDAVAALDWPRDRLQIQVLDDSTDETVELCRARIEALVARGFDAQHLHRRDRRGFKAGALGVGLVHARGELVLILDADFVPPPDLLRRMAGHFADPRMAMVQVRWEHLNREYSALTRVQALLLDGHFVIEQEVRCRTGRFFNFNGTAGLWRRSAIDDAGGWNSDTLTEDLDLSYRALLRGWRFHYLVGTTAPAELPVHMNGFKGQQFRWAKGGVQVARKLMGPLMRAELPWRVKLEAFFHLTQNVPYVLTLLLALLAVPGLVLAGAQHPSWLDLPLMLGTGGVLAAYCLTATRGRSPWVLVYELPLLIAVTAGISASQSRAVIEGALGLESEFVRTPKHGVVARGQVWAGKRYRGARTLIPIAELALAANFAAAVAVTLAAGAWSVLPIAATFAFGFGYVGARSLSSR